MKELENGKKKLLITGMILIIIAVCTAGILLTAVIKTIRKRRQKYRKKVYSAHHRNSPLRQKRAGTESPEHCRGRIAEGTFRGTEP